MQGQVQWNRIGKKKNLAKNTLRVDKLNWFFKKVATECLEFSSFIVLRMEVSDKRTKNQQGRRGLSTLLDTPNPRHNIDTPRANTEYNQLSTNDIYIRCYKQIERVIDQARNDMPQAVRDSRLPHRPTWPVVWNQLSGSKRREFIFDLQGLLVQEYSKGKLLHLSNRPGFQPGDHARELRDALIEFQAAVNWEAKDTLLNDEARSDRRDEAPEAPDADGSYRHLDIEIQLTQTAAAETPTAWTMWADCHTVDDLKSTVYDQLDLDEAQNRIVKIGATRNAGTWDSIDEITNDRDLQKCARDAMLQRRVLQISFMHEHEPTGTHAPPGYATEPTASDLGQFHSNALFIPRSHDERQALVDRLAAFYPHDDVDRSSSFQTTSEKALQATQDADLHKEALDNAPFWREDELQTLERQPRSKYDDLDQARYDLAQVLGANHPLCEGLPPRKKRDAQGNQLQGLRYTEQQTIGIAFLTGKERLYGGGILGDAAGMGKTVTMIAYGLISEACLRFNPRYKANFPTLVVCPAGILSKTVREVDDYVGVDKRVYVLGYYEHQPYDHYRPGTVRIDRKNGPWKHDPNQGHLAGDSWVVVTVEHLATLAKKKLDLQGLWARILVDEVHVFRNAMRTASGKVLRSFQAPYLSGFTGFPIVDSLNDIQGLIAILEKERFKKADHNDDQRHEEFRRYAASLERQKMLPTADDLQVEDADGRARNRNVYGADDTQGHWSPQCPELSGLSAKDAKNTIADGYKCQHYPACTLYNKRFRREPSCDPSKRIGPAHMVPREPGSTVTDEETDVQEKTPRRKLPPAEQPYEERTYDFFSPELNLNCLHALTVEDYGYEIESHMKSRPGDPQRPDIYIDRLRKLLDMFLLSRNHESTYVSGGEVVAGGTALPPMTTRVRNLYFNEEEEKRYFDIQTGCASEFNMNLANTLKSRQDEAYPEDHLEDEDARPARPVHESRGSVCLKMTMSCTHLGLFALRKRSIWTWQNRRHNGLAFHLWELKECGGLNPADKDIWAYESPFEVIKQYFWGAPKLRSAVQEASNHLNKGGLHNRVIKLFQYPQGCESYYKALCFLGFKTLMLSSDVSPTKRQEIIDKFNNPNEDWEILLIPMSLKLMGHAMHQLCHKVIVIEQAANKATEDNATMRIRRLGQTHPQEVDRYIMRRTYMLMREKAMMQKFDGVVRLQFDFLDVPHNADTPTPFSATASMFGALYEQAMEWGAAQDTTGQA